MTATTRRIAPGLYTVTDTSGAVVRVTRLTEGAYRGEWIAAADWDRHNVTDPLPTKARAAAVAVDMLAEHADVAR